jgi:hypothetical protein
MFNILIHQTLFEKGWEEKDRREFNRGGELVQLTLHTCMELTQ